MILGTDITENWKLLTDDESVQSQEIAIKDGLIFGREAECDIYIKSDHVSRQHAQLEVLESLVRIKDLDSANGVFVNGKQVAEAELKDGDILAIDTIKFTVVKPLPIVEVAADKTCVRPIVDVSKTQVRSAVNIEQRPAQVSPELIEDDAGATQVSAIVSEADRPQADDEITQRAPAKPDVESNFDAMSSGATAIGKVWEESDRGAVEDTNDGMTAVMPSVDMDTKTNNSDALQNTFKLDAPVAKLICKSKPLQDLSFDITASPTTIGRVQNNDLVINEASVSSNHAELRFEHGDWYVFDQDSFNGTYVNKNKCSSQKLKHGDVVGIGRMQLLFEMVGKPASSGPKVMLWGGIVAVLLALLAAAAYFVLPMLNSSSLSSSSLWMQIVADNRANPTAAVAEDMNQDGVRDIVIAAQSGRIEIINGVNGLSINAFSVEKNIHSAPLVFDVNRDGRSDIIVATDDGHLAAYKQNGLDLWSFKPDAPLGAIYNQISRYLLNDDNVEDIVLSTQNAGVVAVDGATGQQLWSSAALMQGHAITTPLVGDFNQDGITDIVVVTDNNQMMAFSSRGNQLNILWQQSVPAVLFASPVVLKSSFNNLILLATQNDGVLAFNGLNGSRVWQTVLNDSVFATPIVMASSASDTSVIVSTLSGNVVAINANDGSIRWKTALNIKLQASPVILSLGQQTAEKLLLVVDTDGGFHVLNAADGRLLLSEKQEGADRFVVTPLLTDLNNDGQLDAVMASQNGRIFTRSFQSE